MKDNQDSIYYIAGENRESLVKSPTIQGLLKRGYEVLILDDPIDEFCLQHLQEYEKKKLVNTAKADFKMPEDDLDKKRLKKLKKMYQPLTDWWKKTESQHIDSVVVTQRLTEDPCVIVATEYGYSANMERISKAQAYGQNAGGAGPQKSILEINPHHPIIKELLERVKDGADEETEDMARLLYEAALLNSGYSLSEPASFARRFYRIFNGAMGIPKDAEVSEVEVDIDDDEEEEEERRRRRRNDDDEDEERTNLDEDENDNDNEDNDSDYNNDNDNNDDDNGDDDEQGGRDPDEL